LLVFRLVAMSDSEQPDRSADPKNIEPKAEDPNAPINIKVQFLLAC